MKSKIIVIGSKGMLGSTIVAFLSGAGYEVISLSRENHDIVKDPVENIRRYISPQDTVINCSGVLKPKFFEISTEDILRVNSIFPRNLAEICSRLGAFCFHVSSDGVFSGRKGFYSESDPIDAEDFYGMSKAGGESSSSMVIRTSLIGEDREKKRSLLEWVRSQRGQTIKGFTNHRWNGITTLQFAELIASILKTGLYKTGVFHLFSPKALSKFDLLSTINDVYDLRIEIIPEESKESCNRTLTSLYPLCENLQVKPIRRQIEEMREFLNNSITR